MELHADFNRAPVCRKIGCRHGRFMALVQLATTAQTVDATKNPSASTVNTGTNAGDVAPDKFALGLGAGLDFGGIGLNFTYYLNKNLGLFAGGGYAVIGFGPCAGVKLRLISDPVSGRVSPFVFGMYGYHTVVKVENATDLNKMFYGATPGGGLEVRLGAAKRNYLSIGLSVPIRGKEVPDYFDHLKAIGVEMKSELPPIGISLGYKIANR